MPEYKLAQLLGIKYPIIMAPMFLVSNVNMVKAALDAGITGAIPALNYRTDKELRAAIQELKDYSEKPFGINLIVNKSNPRYKEQLETCVELEVPYLITSLGSPKEAIDKCRKKGIKVICDVVNEEYARKVVSLGADALIAVNSRAGGHAGALPPEELIPLLKSKFDVPVISAGGVGTGREMKEILDIGADGLSIGSIFIATEEADVSDDYKDACVHYGADDIVMTDKLSGSALTVIKTPYVEKIGTKAGWLERLLLKNKRLRKWAKMFIFYRGMKKIEKAALNATYKTVWCAGPSIEHVHEVVPVRQVVARLIEEYEKAI